MSEEDPVGNTHLPFEAKAFSPLLKEQRAPIPRRAFQNFLTQADPGYLTSISSILLYWVRTCLVLSLVIYSPWLQSTASALSICPAGLFN